MPGIHAPILTFLLLTLFSVVACDQGYNNLGGPVAVVHGDAPTHDFLGIEFDPAEQEKLVVAKLVAGTPAASSGLRVGDTLLAIDSTPVDTLDSLVAALLETSPQQVVEVRFLQDGEEQVADIALLSFSEFVVAREQVQRDPGE